jgi:predicted SAM-dependent methyltransferase
MLRRLFHRLPPPAKALVKWAPNVIRRATGTRRLRELLRQSPDLKIVVGTSGVCEPGWIPTDIHYLNLLRESDWARFFSPGTIQAILAEHVWEHLTQDEGWRAARICHRYLKPGGYLRIAVPDGHHPDPDYIRQVQVNGVGAGAEDHKVLYTSETLGQILESAGFSVIPLEYHDAHGKFHHRAWSRAEGMIHRSRQFDERNQDGQLRYTSVLVDAFKH